MPAKLRNCTFGPMVQCWTWVRILPYFWPMRYFGRLHEISLMSETDMHIVAFADGLCLSTAIFTRLNQEGTTILMVTHDSKVAARCGRILYLLDGSIKGEYTPAGMMGEKEREAAVSRWLAGMGW